VLEMDRRLRLLASQGVRNMSSSQERSAGAVGARNLFDEDAETEVLDASALHRHLIDELADLMMLERANVEESVTGWHKWRGLLAFTGAGHSTSSVDVVTGSSRQLPRPHQLSAWPQSGLANHLDGMGASTCFGKGRHALSASGSSRLVRVQARLGDGGEINRWWTAGRNRPRRIRRYLPGGAPATMTRPRWTSLTASRTRLSGGVRVVLEMGKASTSTLAARLRLGYGRAPASWT